MSIELEKSQYVWSFQEISLKLSLANDLSFTEAIILCQELFSHPKIKTLSSHPKYLP